MKKELRDGLKEVITLGSKDCYTISEVLKADYDRYKQKQFAQFDLATYRGKLIVLDIDEENEDISLWESLQSQIDSINSMFEEV